MTKHKLTILISGMIAGVPRQGGAAWAVLQYLLGFKRLGHDVYFVEPLSETALRPAGTQFAASANAAYFSRVTAEFGLEQSAALWLKGTPWTVGLSLTQLRQVARRTDVLIDISGMLMDPTLTEFIPIRVYLDMDPAFTQLWHSALGIDMHLDRHTHFVTVGLALGRRDCLVPTCTLQWITTLPPVVLEHWPVAKSLSRDALTTIANWRGYGSIEHGGVMYGQKAHSVRQFMDLPTRTTAKFVLALGIHLDERKDLAALASNGWQLLDPARAVPTPSRYRAFVQGSKAEFGIAKSGYVSSRSGWFSDRSACYLASGRPVLAQETGFSRFLPVGEGLFTFQNTDDALKGIQQLNCDYPRQRRAARLIAEECLDSDKVLGRLLSAIGATG
jgi:hypothetical protein